MLWIGIGAVCYIILFFWLGIATLRNGHGWLFFFGLFFPLLWIFGAFSAPRSEGALRPREGDEGDRH
jgi:hypothetical protein